MKTKQKKWFLFSSLENFYKIIPMKGAITKSPKYFIIIAAFATFYSFAASPSLYVASSAPDAAPDANGDSVDVWTVTGGVLSLGDSGTNGGGSSAGAGNSAWGFYSDSNFNEAFAIHYLNSALKVGQTISLDFDNGWIESGGKVGFGLLDSDGNTLFEFSFTGGDSFYHIHDAAANFNTGIGFTANGFNIAVALTDNVGGYNATINGIDFVGRSLASANNIEQVIVFNDNAGHVFSNSNVLYANNLQIIPEPSTLILSAILLGTLAMAGCRGRQCQK